MSKISLLDLDKYEDLDPIEHIKKKKTGKAKDRKRQKVDKRQGFIDRWRDLGSDTCYCQSLLKPRQSRAFYGLSV